MRDYLHRIGRLSRSIDGNHLQFSTEGTLPNSRIVARTEPYDHCIFTALDGVDGPLLARFTDLLLGQRFDDPVVRPLLELEGLRQWIGEDAGRAEMVREALGF